MRGITQGDNKPVGSNLGYAAGQGWNACAGLGVPIGTALLDLFTAHATASLVPVGVTTANRQPHAFLLSNDGHLWVNWWDGAAWRWSDQGTPPGGAIAGPVGVTAGGRAPLCLRAEQGADISG